MIVSHNLQAMNARRQYNIVNRSSAKTTEKLSSGYRINRAADDAAGLAISEKMRRQIRGLSQASKNCEDGIGYVQVGDGALNEVHEMLGRMNELAVYASNGTLTDDEREMIDQETQQLKNEIKRTCHDTSFNEIYIFRASYTPEISGVANDYQIFNVGGADAPGGAIVNNRRFTWKELGIDESMYTTDSNGKQIFKKNFSKKIVLKDDKNHDEILEVKGYAGKELGTLERVYRWTADSDGIMVNENSAEKVTWAQMGITNPGNVPEGEYSFNYHGMTISFEVDEPKSTLQDVIEGINGDGVTETYWNTKLENRYPTGLAADILTETQTVTFSSSNEAALTDTGMKVVTSATGITLESDAVSHTQKQWENMADTTSGDYPIVDWGTNAGNNEITLNNVAKYNYTDTVSDISFDFKLADEAALSEVIDGMSVGVNRSFSAPMTASRINNLSVPLGGGSQVQLTFSNTNMSFAMQNILRDSMAHGYTWTTDFNITDISAASDGSRYSMTLSIQGDGATHNTATYSANSLYLSDLKNAIKNGSSYTLTLNLDNEAELSAVPTTAQRTDGIMGISSSDRTVKIKFDASTLGTKYNSLVNDVNSKYSIDVNKINSDRNSTNGSINTLYTTYTSTVTMANNTYRALENAYNSASTAYDTAVANYNAAETDYNTKLSEFNSAQTAYNSANTAHETAKAEYEAAVAAADGTEAEKETAMNAAKTALDAAEAEKNTKESAMNTALSLKNTRDTEKTNALNAKNTAEANKTAGAVTRDNTIATAKTTFKDSTETTFKNYYNNSYIPTTDAYKSDINDLYKAFTGSDAAASSLSGVTLTAVQRANMANDAWDNIVNSASSYTNFENAIRSLAETKISNDYSTMQSKYYTAKNKIIDDALEIAGDQFAQAIMNGNSAPDLETPNPAKATVKISEKSTSNRASAYSMMVEPPKKDVFIQAGSEAGQHIDIEHTPLNLSIMGIADVSNDTVDNAQASINSIKGAYQVVSSLRSSFGAYQNRLEHTINNLDNVVENTTSAESGIRDTDMSSEMVKFSMNKVLMQAGEAVLTQANQANQGVLSLLR